eukprot:scaffold3360_cov238-Alexandrium_tamarense.AAC.2
MAEDCETSPEEIVLSERSLRPIYKIAHKTRSHASNFTSADCVLTTSIFVGSNDTDRILSSEQAILKSEHQSSIYLRAQREHAFSIGGGAEYTRLLYSTPFSSMYLISLTKIYRCTCDARNKYDIASQMH